MVRKKKKDSKELNKVNYVYRFRLYPKKDQIKSLNKQMGCCRFVYNKLLSIAKEKKDWNYYRYQNMLPQLKKEYPFLKECNAQSLQYAVRQLDMAFQNFFKDKAKYPKFKKKKHTNSIVVPQNFTIKDNRIKIPKISSYIRFIKHREIKGNIKNISITKTLSGKFYLNIVVSKVFTPLPQNSKVIAIDVGLTYFCTFSNGKRIKHPKYFLKTKKKIKRIQEKLSNKQVGSKRYKILRKRLMKLHEKTMNQRKDFLHKLSKKIISDNQAIIVESLNIKNMLKNQYLAKYIIDASWGKFILMLEYKANLYGRTLIKVKPFYPSTQICSVCGYKNKKLTLSDRVWTCPNCGTVHDRDVNAAQNLFKLGVATLTAVGVGCPNLTPVKNGKPSSL